jgi:hypothetical protein
MKNDRNAVRVSRKKSRRLGAEARQRKAAEGQLKVGEASLTAYDHAKKAGLIGMVKSTVRELSTNREYFEGFGSS